MTSENPIANIWNAVGKNYWKGRKRGPMSNKQKLKVSESKKGTKPWNTGKKRSEKTKQKISETMKKKYEDGFESPFKEGHKIRNTGKTRFKKGQESPHKGKTGRYSEEIIQKIREARLNQTLPKRDTLIERLLQKELTKRGIKYKKHLSLCGICQPDIILSDRRIVIFADGEYWHTLNDRQEKDQQQNKTLKENGWNVYRFWGTEIKENPSKCIDMVLGGD